MGLGCMIGAEVLVLESVESSLDALLEPIRAEGGKTEQEVRDRECAECGES
jgi:hypothetical protein